VSEFSLNEMYDQCGAGFPYYPLLSFEHPIPVKPILFYKRIIPLYICSFL